MEQIEFEQIKRIKKNISLLNHTSTFLCPALIPKDRSQIRNIIGSMINIQALIAKQYFYKTELGISKSVDHSFFITNNLDQEIEMFASIFNEVIILKNNDGRPINIQVSNTNDVAYNVFSEMITMGEINKCIAHFYVGEHFKQDFCNKAFFEIDKSDCKTNENIFFDYLIKGSLSSTMITTLYIDVSGFEIDEIEKDPYVQQLTTFVKHLYLLIFDNGSPEFPCYIKQLRWYL